MGSRADSDNLTQEYEETVITPAYEQCSKDTEDCSATKCCKTTGYKCFSKTATTAKCRMTCKPGKDGLCTELVNLKAMEPPKGLRFFCFTYYMSNTGSTKKSYELELIQSQYSMKASIFGCPAWAVYSDTDATLGGADKTIKVSDVDGDFHLFKRKKTGTWVNAMQFYQAWMDMKKKGSTTGSDWVVKVDIDSVFLPSLETCKASLDWKGLDPDWKFGPYGEDLFMQMCLDSKGVPRKSDYIWDADGACKNNLPKALRKVKGVKWLPNCLDINHVVSHPFKKPDEYHKCLAATSGYTAA